MTIINNKFENPNNLNDYLDNYQNRLTIKTQQQYTKKANQIINLLQKNKSNLDFRDIQNYLINRINNNEISQSTARFIKSIFLFKTAQVFNSFNELEKINKYKQFNEIYQSFKFINTTNIQKDIKETAAKKTKYISKTAIKLLNKHYQKTNNKTLELLISFININSILGLRPIEWFNMSFIENDNFIDFKIKNAKSTHGRANGEYREFTLNRNVLNSSLINDFNKIFNAVNNAKLNNMESELFFKKLAKPFEALAPIFKKKNLKCPCLYSTRHQAIANMKKLYSKRNVAAIVGHKSTHSTNMYSSSKYANSPIKLDIKPSEASLENVNQVRLFEESSLAQILKEKNQKQVNSSSWGLSL